MFAPTHRCNCPAGTAARSPSAGRKRSTWTPPAGTKGSGTASKGEPSSPLCRDVILPDGSAQRHFEPLWWRSGRYIALLIETGEEPLTLERIGLLETRYPLAMESHFGSSDARLDAITADCLAWVADVRPRDLHGLPLLRAVDVCRRYPLGSTDHLRHQPG
jgi:hypothetical protein